MHVKDLPAVNFPLTTQAKLVSTIHAIQIATEPDREEQKSSHNWRSLIIAVDHVTPPKKRTTITG